MRRALLSLLVAAAIAAPVASAAERPTTVYAFSDGTTMQPTSVTEAGLRALRPSLCAPTGSRGGPLPLGAALGRIDAQLERTVGSGRLATLARLPTPALLARAAGSAPTAPAASLAALVTLHRREPREPGHLVGASVFATQVGLAREALALLDAADRLPAPTRTPFGLRARALSGSNRGYALFAQHRFAAAIPILKRAVSAEPLLAEARANLAAAYLCSGRLAEAAVAYRSAQRRAGGLPELPLDGEGASTAPGATGVDPTRAFDLSHGVEATLPAIDLPRTPEEAAGSYAALDQAARSRNEEAAGLFDRASALVPTFAAGPPARVVRRASILFWAGYVEATPAIRGLYRTMRSRYEELAATTERVWLQEIPDGLRQCEGLPTPQDRQCRAAFCVPHLADAHAQWLPRMEALDAATRAWASEYYRLASGLAANLAEPAAHEYALLAARQQVVKAYAVYDLGLVAGWAFGADLNRADCVTAPGEAAAETTQADLPSVDLCPPTLKAVKLTIRIPPLLSVSINCEKVDVEASRGPLTPFLNVSFAFKSRKTTVFGGVKGGIGEIAPFGPSAKGGLYVTFDGAGGLADAGVRFAAGGGLDSGVGVGVGAGRARQYSFAGSVL